MNEKTKIEIDKLNANFDKILKKDVDAELNDVYRILEIQSVTLITMFKQLTEIREILERKDDFNE